MRNFGITVRYWRTSASEDPVTEVGVWAGSRGSTLWEVQLLTGIELGPGDDTRLFRTSFLNFGASVQVWGISGSRDRVSKVG